MKKEKIFCLLMAVILFTVSFGSAWADDSHVLTPEELAAAWALTGLDEGAAEYRPGMPFSGDMNAHQMREWLDELLREEVAALKQMHSRLENALYDIKQENIALYTSVTGGSNEAQYQRLLDSRHAAEALRERIRWCREQLDRHTGIIQGRMELIGRADFSGSAKLTASREIEESTEAIRKIRGELAENAENWLQQIKDWYGGLAGSAGANGPGDKEQQEWVDTILSYRLPETVHSTVSASVLYPAGGSVLTARLSPISSALADSGETIAVDVVDENSIAFQIMNSQGTRLEGIPVTISAQGVRETRRTDEIGGVIFENADRFSPNEDAIIIADLEINFDSGNSAFRKLIVEEAEIRKGEKYTEVLADDNGLETPYILGASFGAGDKNYNILTEKYTAFYSSKNDMQFDLRILTSSPAEVVLRYTGTDGKRYEKTAKTAAETADGKVKNAAVFTETWKRMVMPDTKMTAEVKDQASTTIRTLELQFVQGVVDEAITSLDGLSSVFEGIGLHFTVPKEKLNIADWSGGMTFSIDGPWKSLMFNVVGNLDGSFLGYVGGAEIGFNLDKLKAWRSKDQKQVDSQLNDIEKRNFKDQFEKTRDAIASTYSSLPGHRIPVLGSFCASVSFGIGFLGRYVGGGTDEQSNYQYSWQFILGGTVSFDAGWNIVFIPTPPVFLDIHLQLSFMLSVRFAAKTFVDPDRGVTKAEADWGAWGINLTVRFTISLGIAIGIPGILDFTMGGYVWIQVSVSVSFGSKEIQAMVTLGGAAFVAVNIFVLHYSWDVYDSGEILLAKYPKDSANTLPWYETLIASAKADEAEEKGNDGVEMRPEGYPALAPQASPVLENFLLGDSNIQIRAINGEAYAFYIDHQGALVICRLKDGKETVVAPEQDYRIYSFDVKVQPLRRELYPDQMKFAGNDLVLLAFASADTFLEKEITGPDGNRVTLRVPGNEEKITIDTNLYYFDNGTPVYLFPGSKSTFMPMRVMGNLQASLYQGSYYSSLLAVCQVLADDAVGDQGERNRVEVYTAACNPARTAVWTWSYRISDLEPGTGNPFEQILSADITNYDNTGASLLSEKMNTIYTLQDGKLDRKDYLTSGSMTLTVREENVEFFTAFQDPEELNGVQLFWLESDGAEEGQGGESGQRHLRTASISQPASEPHNMYMTVTDLDVTVTASNFQAQQVYDTLYLYWLETAPKENSSDPDVYRLQSVAYEPELDTATDDFVLAEFTASPGTMPVHICLAEDGNGYYTRQNPDGTASIYSFPHRLVPHADLRGISSGVDMVRPGTDLDLFLGVMNDGNSNLGTLNLEMVLQDDQGNIIPNPDGTEAREFFHADFLHPENSSRTVRGDDTHTITGEHTIYRTDDMAEPLVQSRFNVTRKAAVFRDFLEQGYHPEESPETTTAVSSKHILPGQQAALTLSVHIPADWKSGLYHVTIRLAQNQGDGLENLGISAVKLNHRKHDLNVAYRVYSGPEETDHLAMTIYNHARNGEQLRLYAEMYLDNSPDPIRVDLPYYPEYTAAGMTHTLDMPVSALLGDHKAQKVEIRILAAGTDESAVRNNQFTFYVSGYTDPLRFLYPPVDTMVSQGADAVFSAEAVGGVHPYVYTWEVYRGPDSGWQKIQGAEGHVLTLKAVRKNMDGQLYRCVVTDHKLDRAVSEAAVLTVHGEIPPTGDPDHPVIWMILMGIGIAGLAVLGALNVSRKRRR